MNAAISWVPGLRLNLLRYAKKTPSDGANRRRADVVGNYMSKTAPKKATEQAENVAEVADRVHREALRRYGKAIFDAHRVYEIEIERLAREAGIRVRDAHRPPPEYRTAQSVLSEMGLAFHRAAMDGDHGEDTKRLFRRLSDALRPPVDARNSGHAVKRAAEIVYDYARLYATERESEHRFIVRIATVLLCSRVHEGFRALRAPEVGDLFARYIESTARNATGRAPRKRKAGASGALTAAGILCELNKMARYPLGRNLTPDGVYQAIKRQR